MRRTFLSFLFLCFGLLISSLLFANKANAATLYSVSDTLTTSRPSASTPLNPGTDPLSAGQGSLAVFNNNSTFLASDSATIWGATGVETVTIATVSAAKTTLFLTGITANSHNKTHVVATAITAVHTVKFTTQTSIPSGGSIILTFPNAASSDSNAASPSAATFMFNNLNTTNNVKLNLSSGTTTCTFSKAQSAGNTSTITCNTGTADLAGGTVVTILIGCTSGAANACALANQVPTLINPAKGVSTGAGTADTWTVKINTYSGASGAGTALDNAPIKIGTVESVSVVAHVDPTFSFTIAGLGATQALNTAGTCTTSHAADTANTGYATTATDVNLGTLVSTQVNRTHQQLTISSNSISGYTITATASGHLVNPANGYFVRNAQGDATGNDAPDPVAITAATAAFGIHACDANSKVVIGTWGQATAYFANPAPASGTSSGYYYTLVSSGIAPASAGDNIFVEYAATVAGNTPAGDYQTVLTYVATPKF